MDHVREIQKHALHRRSVGLVGAADPLQVRDITADLDNDELPSPGESCGSLDRPVDGAVPVPVTGDEVHILTDQNPTVVDFDGETGEVEAFLDVNETRIRRCFVVGDERVQPNNRLAMAQGLEVVALNGNP